MENSLEIFDRIFEQAEERISELEIDQLKWSSLRNWKKKNEENLTEPMRSMGHQQEYQHIHNWSPRRRGKREWGRKNIWRNKGWNLPNFINTWIYMSKISVNSKKDKHKETHTERYDQLVKRQRETFETSKRAVTHHIQRIPNRINRKFLIRKYWGLKEVAWHFWSAEMKKPVNQRFCIHQNSSKVKKKMEMFSDK